MKFTKVATKLPPLIFLLPLIYAVVINLYPVPNTSDLNQYIDPYYVFKDPNSSLEEILSYFTPRVDLLAPLFELIFAKIGIPLSIYLFIVTYTTTYLFLYCFNYYFVKRRKIHPPAIAFVIIFMCINITAILSGVRNIHAWSFVALTFVLLDQGKKKTAILTLLYACFFHYAAYVIALSLWIYQSKRFYQNEKLYFKIAISLAFILILLSTVVIPVLKPWIPTPIYLKLDYYFVNNGHYTTKFANYSWKGLIRYLLFENLLRYIVAGLYLTYIYFNRQVIVLKRELTIIYFCLFTFLFFPNVFQRMWLLAYIFFGYNSLIYGKLNLKPIKFGSFTLNFYKAHVATIVFIYAVQCFFFWLMLWKMQTGNESLFPQF